MNLKIFLLQTYPNFENEDLILAILEKFYPCQIVSNISQANVVIRGVFPSQGYYSLLRRLANKLVKKIDPALELCYQNKIREIVDPQSNQLWIHLSGEKPNFNSFSSYYNSECDIGIGHEIINEKNYIRMPHWYQSIDWADSAVPRHPRAFYRLGKPIAIDELTTGIPASVFTDHQRKCALINSHMTSPRDIFYRQIKNIMSCDVYGGGGIKINLSKRDILSEYNFNLAPENTLYPGYITEKIPEAFASGTFPIGWYLNGLDDEFSCNSHLNLATLGSLPFTGDNDMLSIKLSAITMTMKRDGIPPLLNKEPSLDNVISFLERFIRSIKY